MAELAEERLGTLWLGSVVVWWRWLLGALAVTLLLVGGLTAGGTVAAGRQIGPPLASKPVVTTSATTSTTSATQPNLVAARDFVAPTTISTTTTTTVPAWQPADECADVTRPVSDAALRWCPAVAGYLWLAETALPGEQWVDGTLTSLLRTGDCESGWQMVPGPAGSGVFGFFQHKLVYWSERGPKAAALLGFDNPTITEPLDNIAVAVWLWVTEGPQHWPHCGRW